MAILSLIHLIIDIINRAIVPLVFSIAFISFIWGVFQFFIAGAGDTEKRKQAKEFVMYGLIGFFLMISVWGIVNALVGTFGFNSASRPDLPSFNGGGGYGVGVGVSVLGNGNPNPNAPGPECGPNNLCLPWNECIGGTCLPRAGDGGPGDSCFSGKACVNGYHCGASSVCVADTAN